MYSFHNASEARKTQSYSKDVWPIDDHFQLKNLSILL